MARSLVKQQKEINRAFVEPQRVYRTRTFVAQNSQTSVIGKNEDSTPPEESVADTEQLLILTDNAKGDDDTITDISILEESTVKLPTAPNQKSNGKDNNTDINSNKYIVTNDAMV